MINKKTVAVTGAFGFIGSTIIEKLVNSNKYDVIAVDYLGLFSKRSKNFSNRKLKSFSDCNLILDPNVFLEFINFRHRGDITIIHCGANSSTLAHFDDLYEDNITSTKWLSEVKKKTRIIFASSASVYGNGYGPINDYAFSKLIGEKLIIDSNNYFEGKHFVILRLFNVFGTDEHHKDKMASVPFKINKAIKEGKQFDLFCQESSRDFIHDGIVADVFIDAIDNEDVNDKIFDVGTGNPTTFLQVAKNICNRNNVKFNDFINIIGMPSELVDKYQHFTKAKNLYPTLLNYHYGEYNCI